ncbi:uncharacterized protein LOC141573519 [Camelus bactrianus]|uniref:Uncharacterized protein LOC141573519 n=1 Tax=Camelus bactrianus TaxID=9837 RepID=A0AC58NJL2_CAMBA
MKNLTLKFTRTPVFRDRRAQPGPASGRLVYPARSFSAPGDPFPSCSGALAGAPGASGVAPRAHHPPLAGSGGAGETRTRDPHRSPPGSAPRPLPRPHRPRPGSSSEWERAARGRSSCVSGAASARSLVTRTLSLAVTSWRNGSASDSRSEGCVFKSRRGQAGFFSSPAAGARKERGEGVLSPPQDAEPALFPRTANTGLTDTRLPPGRRLAARRGGPPSCPEGGNGPPPRPSKPRPWELRGVGLTGARTSASSGLSSARTATGYVETGSAAPPGSPGLPSERRPPARVRTPAGAKPAGRGRRPRDRVHLHPGDPATHGRPRAANAGEAQPRGAAPGDRGVHSPGPALTFLRPSGRLGFSWGSSSRTRGRR